MWSSKNPQPDPGTSRSAAALCGSGGPLLFTAVVVALTLHERDFMASLGWNALTAPTRDWPSGLALGPGGWVMTATFILSGMMLAIFARGMRATFRTAPGGSTASRLLALSGLAMAVLAFPTDPTNRALPPTWHGLVHDAAFICLGVTLLASLVIFGFAFRSRAGWRLNSIIALVTSALIIPSFTVKGFVFYFFLAAFLTWCEMTAVRLFAIRPPE
jgi:hypothetical protein